MYIKPHTIQVSSTVLYILAIVVHCAHVQISPAEQPALLPHIPIRAPASACNYNVDALKVKLSYISNIFNNNHIAQSHNNVMYLHWYCLERSKCTN